MLCESCGRAGFTINDMHARRLMHRATSSYSWHLVQKPRSRFAAEHHTICLIITLLLAVVDVSSVGRWLRMCQVEIASATIL